MGKSAVKGLFYTLLVTATFMAAAITIAAAYSGGYHPKDSAYMPLLGLVLPVLLIINIIIAICWGIGKKRWAFVPLIAIGLNWEYFTAIFQFRSAQEETLVTAGNDSIPHGRLKIATYNVHSFGDESTGYSCKKIAHYMQQEKVDVLCFQEFGDSQDFPADSIRKVLSYWKHAIIPTEDSIQGILPIAIFSRYPLVNKRFITYPESANCSMQCDVVLNKDTIRILNNHLQTTNVSQNRKKWKRELASDDTRRELKVLQGAAGTLHANFVKRAEQTDSICRWTAASPYPVLVCGDLNSIPSSYTYHQLEQMLEDGFKTCGHGYMYTYRYYKRLLRIDYIFHSHNLEGVNYDSPNLDLCSDHNPVLMEVKRKKIH